MGKCLCENCDGEVCICQSCLENKRGRCTGGNCGYDTDKKGKEINAKL